MSFPQPSSQSDWDWQPPGPPRRWRIDSVTGWLILINVVIFLIDDYSGWKLTQFGAFTIHDAIHRLQLWRFITFQFLHGGWLHILFNMIALFFFGPLVERVLGRWRYLWFYLVCGCAGPCALMLLGKLHLLQVDAESTLVGASAGIFGIVIAAARIAPNQRVIIFLYFFPLPMRLITMAWLFIGMAVFVVLTSGANAGGQAAHLGGAAVGFILIRLPGMLSGPQPKHRFWQPGEDNFLRDEFK